MTAPRELQPPRARSRTTEFPRWLHHAAESPTSALRSDESGPTPAARRLRGLRRVGVGSRSNHAAIFQLPDLTLVPFDLRTAPLFGCDLVQEGHNSVIASIDQRSRCRRGVDTG